VLSGEKLHFPETTLSRRQMRNPLFSGGIDGNDAVECLEELLYQASTKIAGESPTSPG
jgi:hypothetical protein